MTFMAVLTAQLKVDQATTHFTQVGPLPCSTCTNDKGLPTMIHTMSIPHPHLFKKRYFGLQAQVTVSANPIIPFILLNH